MELRKRHYGTPSNRDFYWDLKAASPAFNFWLSNDETTAIGHANKDEHKVITYINGVSSQDSQFSTIFETNFIRTICAIGQDRQVFIFNPIPEMGINVPKEIIKNKMFGDSTEISLNKNNYNARTLKKIIEKTAEQCNAIILYPAPYLCDETKCFGTSNNR